MRRLVAPLHFILVLFFCAFALAAEPEEKGVKDIENLYLYRIVVSPLRIPQEIEHIPQNISVVDQGEISNLPVSDPSEALALMPGVDVSSRTSFGHLAPLSIQGSESRHVLVMIDGIPFNTQASGQADILPALPLQALDRIEVIKGSASSTWGSSLGGVVHLITKSPSPSSTPTGHLASSWSGFRSQNHLFDVSATQGHLGYYFSGEYQESGGARIKGGTFNRDDTLMKKGFGKLVYDLSENVSATASYGYSGADINEGVYPSDGTRNHVPYYARYGLFRLNMEQSERNHAEAAFKFNRQFISMDSLDGNTETLSSHVRTRDNYNGVEFKNVTTFREKDTLVLGADISYHILKSTQLSRSKDIFFGAPYASYTWICEPVDLIASARYDLNEEFGDQFNPSLGAVFHMPGARETLLRLNVSRSMSAPPILWKYFEDIVPGFTANNPDLTPERAWTYEAGFETRPLKPLRLGFKLFYSDISDAIATVARADGLFIKKNLGKFRQQGFEFESNWDVTPKSALVFSADFNDVENLATQTTVRGRGVTRPGYRLGLEVNAFYDFKFRVLGRYNRWDSSAAAQPNDRKFIFDLRLQKPITNIHGMDVSCFVNVYNLTNSKYWSDRDFPLPQRYFEGGVTLEF